MFNKKPMKVLEQYLDITTLLIKNASSKPDSLETYVLQESLLDSLIEKMQLTKDDINNKMIYELGKSNPNY